MSILQVLIILIAAGVILWLANSYIPMDGKIKKILNVVVIIAVIFWLLSVFGVIDAMRNVRLGRDNIPTTQIAACNPAR